MTNKSITKQVINLVWSTKPIKLKFVNDNPGL